MQLGAGDNACSGSSVEGQERRTWPGAAKHAKLSMWPFVSSSATRPRGSQMILPTPRHVFRTSSISSLLCPGFLFSCSRHSSVVSSVLYQQYAMNQTHHAARWIQICPISAMPSHSALPSIGEIGCRQSAMLNCRASKNSTNLVIGDAQESTAASTQDYKNSLAKHRAAVR